MDADVEGVVLRSGYRRCQQIRSFRQTHEDLLLLFAGGPHLAHARDPCRVEQDRGLVGLPPDRDAVVELVGGDALDALAGHGHRRVRLEARGAQKRHQDPGLVLAHAAAVPQGHRRGVQRVPLARAHVQADVPDVLGGPVVERGDPVLVPGQAGRDLVGELLQLRRDLEAARLLLDVVEPHGLGLPVGGGRQDELGSDVGEGDHAGLLLQRLEPPHRDGHDPTALRESVGHLGGGVVELVLEGLVDRDGHAVALLDHRPRGPERHDVVKLSLHRRYEARLVRPLIGVEEERIGEADPPGDELDGISGVEPADRHRLVARVPVDQTLRVGVIHDGLGVQLADGAGRHQDSAP